ncbi:MAG TPA: hypothetical protein PKW66_25630, partial [Polyangiaceae bacterium]|nr:hypothetical protein [Polyangiaceae bacterium]
MRTLIIALATVIVVLLMAPRAQAIESLTAQDVVSWAQYAVGYSYRWGHASWRTDKALPGRCSGTCPRCQNSGPNGADCSGFLAKVWRVPSSIPMTTDSPNVYSTLHFYSTNLHWSRIDRADVKQADAMVYRAKNKKGQDVGHIFLYDSKDPWGIMWTYECLSCKAGCVHHLRTAPSPYQAIRRNSMVTKAKSCTYHHECSTGNCAWNGDIYCCRDPGFTGETCYHDHDPTCPNGKVCAFNGKKFVCADRIDCEGSKPTDSGGSSGSGSSGSSAASAQTLTLEASAM